MSCFGRLLLFGWKFVVAVIIVGMISSNSSNKCECMRVMKGFKNTLGTQLPKGFVPPSGPSLCHNKLNPYRYNTASASNFPSNDDYVICP